MRQITILFVLLFFSTIDLSAQGLNMDLIQNSNPSAISSANESYSALWGYVAPDNKEYAILGAFDGTYFYRVTNAGNQLVGFVPTPSPNDFGNSWREMKVYSHYAYIVSEASGTGVQIIDLQYLPDSVHYVGKFITPGHSSTHSVSQSENFLYLNGSNSDQGTIVLDLTNPTAPVRRGTWNERYVHDCRVINDTMWSSNISDGYLSVIDASNKDNLVTIASWQTVPSPFTHNSAITRDRKYIYTTDETTNPPGKIKIWNIQDLSNVIFQTQWAPQGFENTIVHNVEIYDTIAVIAHYAAGVRVLNISNPVDPREIAWYDTYPEHNQNQYDGCWGVYMFPSGIIIASDRKHGLMTLMPDLNPTPGMPDADFMAAPLTVEAGNQVSFLDLTKGVPSAWQWTITGNQNFISSSQNPVFTFNQVGQYNVKLRASNSFGADSITKNNYINVIPTILHPFSFNVTGIQRVTTSANDTSTITYRWTRSAASSGITYKFRAQKFGGTDFVLINSNNNGQDTSITLRKSFLDSLAAQFGTNGDSVLLTCKAYAYNGFDSLGTGNNLVLNLVRTTVGINQISSEIPGEFKLENNYPNPFNPETTIKYQLPKAAFVSIKLYDITGREVAQLINQRHEAGYYDYQFNATYLSSGVYFYRIEAGDFTDIKRMVLVK
jgi:choice-of-anchor B domain-containing protein